jgi:hypothetical protein
VPFAVALAVFFTARRIVLGTAVGGYSDLRQRFLAAPVDRAGDLVRVARSAIHPAFDAAGLPGAVLAVVIAALVGGALWAGASRAGASRVASRDETDGLGSCALCGAAWVAIFLAPFAFVGLVPANGRYAYLAIAGAVLAMVALAGAIAARWPRAGTLLAALALTTLAADWVLLLRAYLDANDRAAVLVAAVRGEVARVSARAPAGELLLIEDAPDFVKGTSGAPLAKVFQYGLAQSVRPPFGTLDRPVVAVPASIAEEARRALGELGGAARYRWDAASGAIAEVPHQPAPPSSLDLLAIDPTGGFLEASCDRCDAARLVVLTAVLPWNAPPIETGVDRARFAIPAAFLRGAALHDGGPAFFWIEQRADGAPIERSAIARFALAPDPLPSFAEAAAKIRRAR